MWNHFPSIVVASGSILIFLIIVVFTIIAARMGPPYKYAKYNRIVGAFLFIEAIVAVLYLLWLGILMIKLG